MFTLVKVLIGLAGFAFLLAVLAFMLWPTYDLLGLSAESLSRASNNLALIAIALLLYSRQGSTST